MRGFRPENRVVETRQHDGDHVRVLELAYTTS